MMSRRLLFYNINCKHIRIRPNLNRWITNIKYGANCCFTVRRRVRPRDVMISQVLLHRHTLCFKKKQSPSFAVGPVPDLLGQTLSDSNSFWQTMFPRDVGLKRFFQSRPRLTFVSSLGLCGQRKTVNLTRSSCFFCENSFLNMKV